MRTNYAFSCPADPDAEAGMLNFLSKFDSINKKYDFEKFRLNARARAIVSEFELMQQFGNLTKHEFSDIRKNLELVYWDKDVIKKDVLAYYLVEDKIIHQYLAIPQLDKLFDEDYFDFEWDMHVGQNFSEHRNEYYRDHFIHQIRDMYMMLIMLDRIGFYEASYEILKDQNAGKISDYTFKKWRQFKTNWSLPQRLILCDAIDEMFPLDEKGEEPSKETEEQKKKEREKKKDDYAEEYFFRYVIYASSMLSALFHDMGYPICHFLEVRHRISDYNPFMYMFTHNAVDSFDELAAKLSNSLLFTIVSSHEIKTALQIGKNGRYNHGAYSAIAFLLQFYENGLLFSLSPEKQCAIELAAVAIYNHTAKYDIIDYKEENSYCSPVFRQNPVSFLLRFCDDLQEWDRRYFEISSASDLIFCPKCGAPMLKDLEKDVADASCAQYKCLCKGHAMSRPDPFIKRKLFLVTVTDHVNIDLEEEKDKDGKFKDGTLTVSLNYDLYKLLLLSSINNTYAKYRAKELHELKKLISYQDYSYQTGETLRFRHIKLDYFMSANPLLIKLKILETFVKKVLSRDILGGTAAVLRKAISAELPGATGNTKHFLPFYISLLRDCIKGRRSDTVNKAYVIRLNNIRITDPEYAGALDCLIEDCFEQYKKEICAEGNPFRSSESYKAYSKRYINKKKEDQLYYAISLFTDQRSRCNSYSSFGTGYVGYYADLHLFFRMNKEIKERS